MKNYWRIERTRSYPWGRWTNDTLLRIGTSVALALIVLFAALISALAGYDSFTCHRTLTNRGLEGHFDFWAEGCYVHLDDGRVLPLDDVKPTQIEINTREGADS